MLGVELSPRPQQDQLALDEFLHYVEVLGFPDEGALHYAEIRAALKLNGNTIGATCRFPVSATPPFGYGYSDCLL